MIISHYTKARWAPIILRDLQLKVSSAHTLNDPFEVSPKVDPKFYQNAAPILFREADNTREAFRLYGAKWGYSDFRVFELDASNWIPRLVDNIPLNVAAAQENFAEKFSAYFRLFFASKTSDSILMWSHYGEHHTGVVVEFETHYRPFSELEPRRVFQSMTSKAG